MPTLVTRVELIDLIGLRAPQPLGTCEISDGPQATKAYNLGKKNSMLVYGSKSMAIR